MPMNRRCPRLLVLALACVVLVPAMAPRGLAQAAATPALPPAVPPAGSPAALVPPFPLDDLQRIENGRRRFGSYCAAYCHGFEGSGGKTPAFRGRQDFTPEMVFRTITEGRAGSDVMPSWIGFSEEKRWELVAYIMSLAHEKPR